MLPFWHLNTLLSLPYFLQQLTKMSQIKIDVLKQASESIVEKDWSPAFSHPQCFTVFYLFKPLPIHWRGL